MMTVAQRIAQRTLVGFVIEVIEEACGSALPDDYQIVIRLETGGAEVELIGPDGLPRSFATNHKSLVDELYDATKHAKSEATDE